MKKIFFIVFSMILFFPVMISAAGNGEILHEYEELLAKVSGNYKEALRSPESRFGQEYEKTLQHFVSAGRTLASAAKSYGDDFNFGTLSQHVENMFRRTRDFLKYRKDGKRNHTLLAGDFKEKKMKDPYRQQEKYSRNKSSSSRRYSSQQRNDEKRTEFLQQHDPLSVIKILVADMKKLQNCGFGREGKFPYVNRNVEEYKRCVDFYRQHYLAYIFQKNSPQYQDEVKRRTLLMLRSAQIVMEQTGNRNGAVLSCNLTKETSILLRVTGFYEADTANRDKLREKVRAPHNRKEAQYSFNRINETIMKLRKNTVFVSEKGAVKSAGRSPGKEAENSLQELPVAELKKKLVVLRKKLLEKNTDMTGVDKDTLKKFRLLLCKEEIKNFDRICKEYVKNGYDEDAASRYACVRFMNTGALNASRKELIQIFSRYEREINRESDKKVDF